ncbi:MAG: autotransporter-associated beta strand repeat protein [Chthoniobacter sp.]|nr:autotransporter-associated beta strand repeat protein [Chthoniobacter sp.]
MQTNLARYAAVPLTAVLLCSSAFAVDYTWKGGGSVDILDPVNWVNGAVPPNDGTSINLRATDKLLFVDNAPVIPNDSGRAINLAAGAQIVGNSAGNKPIDALVNMQGTGPDGNGALYISSGGWVLPQNLTLTGATTITSIGQRFRIDGGPNRLDLGGQTLIVRGSGETNLVNTNVYGTSGTIIARQIFSMEGQTRLDPNVTVDMAPGTLYTSWDGGNARREAAVKLRDGAQIETRLRDANLTFVGPITVEAGDTGTLRAQIQNNGGEAGNGTDMRLNVIGTVAGGGRIQQEGNGTLIMSGNNTYSGGTNLGGAAGSVLAASNTALGTGSVSVGAATTLHLSNAGGLESRDDLGITADAAVGTLVNPLLTGLHSAQDLGTARFTYTGKINNTSGGDLVYTFVEQYDDEVYLTVNDNMVLNNSSWDIPSNGQIVLPPGEHNIRVSVRDQDGGAGPNNGNNNASPGWNVADPAFDIGVGYTTALPLGGATVTPTDYKPLGGGFEVYQPTDRTLANSFSVNSPLTLTTTQMHGYKATLTGVVSGAESLIIQGSADTVTDQLILSGANTYAGNTTVQAGANLRVTGSHVNAGAYTVETGAVLLIDGTLQVTNVATPNTPADLLFTNDGVASFGASAVVALELFSNLPDAQGAALENDELITGGSIALTLGGTLTVTNPNNINDWSLGNTWDLFDWSVPPTSTFTTVNLPTLPPNLSWNTSDLYSGGTIGIVPEPSSAALLAFVAGAGLFGRRRRLS